MTLRGRKERQIYRFFGLSLLLHILSALLFTVFADRVMKKCHEEVFYIDLNQSSMPIATPAEAKSNSAAKKRQQAPVPIKVAQPIQQAKAPSPPMQQTVFSETAPIADPAPVSGPVHEARGASGPQTGGSAQTAVSGNPTEGTGPAGDAEFGSASGPSFLKKVLPLYPMVAKRFNREGKVVLRLTIDTIGSLLSVEVLQDPGYGFAAAAVDAVKKSRFIPARHAGRPFITKAILPVRFSLQGVD